MRTLPFARIAVGVVALITGVACSSAPTDDRQHQQPSGSDPQEGAIVVVGGGAEAATDIGPEGGTVTHASGAKIVVPPGALAKRTHITLKATTAPSAKTLTATPLGVGYEAGPDGQKFLKPVKIVIPFEQGRLLPNVDANNAQIRMAPHGSTSFEALVSRVDMVSHTIETETVHFTDFVPAQDPNPVFINQPVSSSLPNAKVGDFYSLEFGAVGGFNPHVLSLASGTLPNGLALSGDGFLTGIPDTSTTSAFFVKATDDTGRSVQRAFSLTLDQANNPEPTLNHITQTSAEAGSGDTTISFIGYDFAPSSVALWDNSPLPTAYVSSTELAATVPASLLTTPSMHLVGVRSPPPGGGTSALAWFTINEVVNPNPVPSITSVDPTTIAATTNDTQIAITGSNFIASTSAVIGTAGQGLSTYYVSSTMLYASIPASYLANAGTLQISVYNPPSGGGFSASSMPLTVVGSITPAGVTCVGTETIYARDGSNPCTFSGTPISTSTSTTVADFRYLKLGTPSDPGTLCIASSAVNAVFPSVVLQQGQWFCSWTNDFGPMTRTVTPATPFNDVAVDINITRRVSGVQCRQTSAVCTGHEQAQNAP